MRLEYQKLAQSQQRQHQEAQQEMKALKEKEEASNMRIFDLQKAHSGREDELANEKSESDRRMRELEQLNSEFAEIKGNKEKQCLQLQQQLAQESSQLKRARKELNSSKSVKDHLVIARRKIKELESRLELAKSAQPFREAKEENDKDRLCRSLKAENQVLRNKMKDYELNSETLRDLTIKNAKNDKTRMELARLQAQHEPIASECKQWRALGRSLLKEEADADADADAHDDADDEGYGPAEVERLLRDLRKDCLLLKAGEGSLQTSLEQARLEHGHLRKEHEAAKVFKSQTLPTPIIYYRDFSILQKFNHHAHTHTHTHTHTLTHPHTHTHTYILTHSHTHTLTHII